MADASPDTQDPEDVRGQLHRILQSPRFRTSPRASDFLRYAVAETLDGRGAGLDQYTIGTRALGRQDDFYPAEDPSVRMQATRTRRALEHFYLTEGTDDPVIISLPAGSYIPVFRRRQEAAETRPLSRAHHSNPDHWPKLLLAPFRNLTGKRDLDFVAVGLMEDLAVELDHYLGLRVFLNPRGISGEGESVARQPNAAVDFELIGALSQIGGEFCISIHLLRAKSGEQLWAEEFRFWQPEVDLAAIRNELPLRIAATLADEQGLIPLHAGKNLLQGDPDCSGVYEAILMGYHFDRTMSPEAFTRAFEALSKAVETDCQCGIAWALLSRLWAFRYSHELSGRPEGIEKAIDCGRTAVRLSPQDVSTRVALAYALLLGDRIGECRREAETALNTNPHTLFFLDAVGYVLTLAGDWKQGPELSRRAIRLNPYPRQVVHSGLWLDAIRREDYDAAVSAAEKFTPEGTFWKPLMRLTARVLSGGGKHTREAEELLKLKPDFPVSGRRLIRKYVKFADIRDRIEEGLSGAGIVLNGT